jgi:hypothetical protein
MASFSSAPFWRRICSGPPSVGSLDASMVAAVSPQVSSYVMV